MDEEEKLEQVIPQEEQGEIQDVKPTKRSELQAMLGEEIPDYNADDDEVSAEQLMAYIKEGKDQKGRLADALKEDPRLAQVLADVVGKKRGAGASFARYFGKDLISAEEGTPEYDELLAAEEERKKELEAADVSRKEYEDNLNASMPILEKWCEENGEDKEAFLDYIWENIISPIYSGKYTAELCDLIFKGKSYDKDTTDAMAAGEVKGRNANINKMKEDIGDGMPKNIVSTPPEEEKPRKPKNAFLSKALGA